jgi:hypothetical protein
MLLRRRLATLVALLVTAVTTPAAWGAVDTTPTPPDGGPARGLVALQTEVMLLVELGALPDTDPWVADVHTEWRSSAQGMARDELLSWLDDAEADGVAALRQMRDEGRSPSRAVQTTLGTLAAADRDRLAAGDLRLADREYGMALHDLVERGGAPRSPSAVGPSRTPARDAPVLDAPVAGPAVTTTPAGTRLPTGPLAALGVAIPGAAVVLLGRRRVAAPAADRRGPDTGHGALFDALLEANRRMTTTTDAAEARAICVETAVDLTGARAGAYLQVSRGAGLAVAAQTTSLLEGARLGDGMLGRAAETGQAVRAVSHDEPALTSLPAAIAVAPVIGEGRVTALLVVVRDDHHPFTEADERHAGARGR